MENLFEKLPKEFTERLKNSLGDVDFKKYEKALSEMPIRGLRVNKRRIDVDKFMSETSLKLKPLGFCDDGFLLDGNEKLGNTAEHLSGLIYLQEPSSMLAVCASEIEKDNRPLKVLDLCASPGGKSSQIASRISEDSILFSNEIIKSRAQVLFSNIERQGFKNVVVLNEEPKNLLCFERYFDYVFVDAPCSGEGMFRKSPETILEWSEKTVEMCAARQKEILEIATKLVAPEGKLIYSTCTFAESEDERIVEWMINEKNYEILDVKQEIKEITLPSTAKIKNANFARKFLPFSGSGEGQFVAVFKNNSDAERNQLHVKKHFNSIFEIGNTNFKIANEFFQKSLSLDIKKRLIEVGENIFVKPKCFDAAMQTMLDSLRFVSIGVRAGSIQKGRFEPHHNLFMAHDNEFLLKVEMSDENLKKYLHGEEIMCDITPQNSGSYAVLTKSGMPIGGGKIVQNRVKNLYPKGMRI